MQDCADALGSVHDEAVRRRNREGLATDHLDFALIIEKGGQDPADEAH